MSTPEPPEGQARRDLFPSGIPFIVGNEGAERFSFYGMKAILYIYLAGLFGHLVANDAAAKAQATGVVHTFVAAVYAFPMIGAILADRLLGKYRVILWISLAYCVGHGLLAAADVPAGAGAYESAKWIFYAGLAFIAIGSGGIKPCVSANVGDQFTAQNGHLVGKVFQIFYFIINFGSFFATVLIPLFLKSYGPSVAFAVPGVLMAIATFVFWLGRGRFVKVPPKPAGTLGLLDFLSGVLLFVPFVVLAFFGVVKEGIAAWWIEHSSGTSGGGALWGPFVHDFLHTYWVHLVVALVAFVLGLVLFSVRQALRQDDGFLAVLWYSFRNRAGGARFFDAARQRFGEEAAEGPPAVLRIMGVFAAVSVFWALFDQHASTWTEQARHMELALTLPTYLAFWFCIPAVFACAVFGGVWLFAWVGNSPLPRPVVRGAFAAFGLWALVVAIVQAVEGGWSPLVLEAAQIQAYNPLMVMIIIPLLNLALFDPLARRGRPVRPLQKMTVGMFMAGFAFAIAALLQLKIERLAPGAPKIHALWQVLQYFVMTTAEVLVSTTGLEFAYTQAPRRMKSTIMGLWLLCVTVGDLIVAFLSPLEKMLALSQFFWTFAGMMAAAAVVFALMAWLYKGKTYLQEAR
jgi:proton-dependent oligopeptide transporter, POT family